MPRDINTKIVIYVQSEFTVTNPDVTVLIVRDTNARTGDMNNRWKALITAAS
jgi:hypothetical protein